MQAATKGNAKHALIGINPNTKEVTYLAVCGDCMQEYWDEMPADLIPAIVPVEVARNIAFQAIGADALTAHVFAVQVAA